MDNYEESNNKFKEFEDGMSKFLFAILYAKKNNIINSEDCQILKKNSKELKKENNFAWRTLLKLKDLESYLTNLEMLLESFNSTEVPKDENIGNLSPYSKQAYINSSSPNDELIFRSRMKKEGDIKNQIQKPQDSLIKLN